MWAKFIKQNTVVLCLRLREYDQHNDTAIEKWPHAKLRVLQQGQSQRIFHYTWWNAHTLIPYLGQYENSML